MSNGKITAVEWQFDELQKAEKDWRNEAIDGKEYIDKKYQILNQAKEMEKQQIIDAWENGYEHGACVNEDNDKYHGIQYYNETYER